MRAPRFLSCLILLPLITQVSGCNESPPEAPLATGAASIEELLNTYENAHRNQSIEDLRNVLIWRANLPGTYRGIEYYENALQKLFQLQLEEVQWIEFPNGNRGVGEELEFEYTRPMPSSPTGIRRYRTLGPAEGKLVLIGRTTNSEVTIEVQIDAELGVLKTPDNRYWLTTSKDIIDDAVHSVQTGQPQTYTAIPLQHSSESFQPSP